RQGLAAGGGRVCDCSPILPGCWAPRGAFCGFSIKPSKCAARTLSSTILAPFQGLPQGAPFGGTRSSFRTTALLRDPEKAGPRESGLEKAGLGCRYLQQRAFADELPDGIANVLLDRVLSVGVLLLQECDDVRHRARAIAQLPDQ